MRSELLFLALMVAPWVLVVAALLFYRHRRRHGKPDQPAGGQNRSTTPR